MAFNAIPGFADYPQSLQRCAAVVNLVGDREPSRILADCLHLQSVTLSNLGRVPEAAECAGRALALARELGYPCSWPRRETWPPPSRLAPPR